MLPLLRSELFRLNRRWMPRILVLVVFVAVALVYALSWATLSTQDIGAEADVREELSPEGVRGFGLEITYFVASIVAVIMAASIVGTEFGWGTIRALLPRARSRIDVIVAKLTALVLFDILLIVVGFLAALAMSALFGAVEDLDTGLDVVNTLAALVRIVYVLLPYSALAFFVAVVTRSNAAGIAIGLVVVLAEGLVVAIIDAFLDPLAWINDLLFTPNIGAITALNDGTADPDLPDPWLATLVLGLWIAVFIAVSLVVFRRRDVTSGA